MLGLPETLATVFMTASGSFLLINFIAWYLNLLFVRVKPQLETAFSDGYLFQ